MTLEEIKTEIQSFIFFAEVEERAEKRFEWGRGFQVGKITAYEKCLELLEQLEQSWHPYPKEKPTKDGELYWVTLDEGDEQRKVLDDLFLNGEFVNYNECSIVAWAEYNRPNPYEGEAYEH